MAHILQQTNVDHMYGRSTSLADHPLLLWQFNLCRVILSTVANWKKAIQRTPSPMMCQSWSGLCLHSIRMHSPAKEVCIWFDQTTYGRMLINRLLLDMLCNLTLRSAPLFSCSLHHSLPHNPVCRSWSFPCWCLPSVLWLCTALACLSVYLFPIRGCSCSLSQECARFSRITQRFSRITQNHSQGFKLCRTQSINPSQHCSSVMQTLSSRSISP